MTLDHSTVLFAEGAKILRRAFEFWTNAANVKHSFRDSPALRGVDQVMTLLVTLAPAVDRFCLWLLFAIPQRLLSAKSAGYGFLPSFLFG